MTQRQAASLRSLPDTGDKSLCSVSSLQVASLPGLSSLLQRMVILLPWPVFCIYNLGKGSC